MKLLTKGIEKLFERVGDQADKSLDDIVIVAKFFNPCGGQTWFAASYTPGDRTFFGFASLFGDHNDEWGYFSLDELESIKGPLGLGIERDIHFEPRLFKEAKKSLPKGSSARYGET